MGFDPGVGGWRLVLCLGGSLEDGGVGWFGSNDEVGLVEQRVRAEGFRVA